MNASRNDSRPGVVSVTSEYRSNVGSNSSFGLVLASCSSLKLLSTVQNTGKKNIEAAIQAAMPRSTWAPRPSPTPNLAPRAFMRSPLP